jgi:hypothetical protein
MNEHIKVLYYHFTPEEVFTLYDFLKNEYIDPKHEDIVNVMNHISKIVEVHNEFPRRNHQTT